MSTARTRQELQAWLHAVPADESETVRNMKRAMQEDLIWRRRGRQTAIRFGTAKPIRLPRSTINTADEE